MLVVTACGRATSLACDKVESVARCSMARITAAVDFFEQGSRLCAVVCYSYKLSGMCMVHRTSRLQPYNCNVQ